jgi:hypothetical protein
MQAVMGSWMRAAGVTLISAFGTPAYQQPTREYIYEGSVLVAVENLQACTFSTAQPTLEVAPSAGSGAFAITTSAPGCVWTAATDTPWITVVVSTGTTGQNVAFQIAANTAAASRTGTIRVGDLVLTVVQAAAGVSCSYELSPTTVFPGHTGQTYQIDVRTGSGCSWRVSSNTAWAQIAPLEGAGPGPLTLTVYPNFNSTARAFAVSLSSARIAGTQAGNPETLQRRFVRLLYFSYFGRLPSEQEVQFQSTANLSRAQLALNFFRSEEFNRTGRFVGGLYVGLLNRDAEFGGWQYQRDALATGLANTDQLVSNFINSPEFTLRNGSLSNDAFVTLLYRQVLLREPSVAEVAFQAGAVSGYNARNLDGRMIVARDFLNSHEFVVGTGPRLTTSLLFSTLLLRDPSPQERELRIKQMQDPGQLESFIADLVSSAEMENVLK